MNKTYVDVEVYNTPRVSLQGVLPQSLSASCHLIEHFLVELCENSSDTLHLIQEGNTVSLGEFEVSLSAEDIIKIRSQDHQTVFFLSFGGVCELCSRQEALSKLAVTVKVELGVIEYCHTPHTREPGPHSPNSSSKLSESEFTGHAYLNMEVEDVELLDLNNNGFGMIMKDIDTFNELGSRDDQFQTVVIPFPPGYYDMEVTNETRREGYSSNSLLETPSSQPNIPQPSTPTIMDYRTRQASSSPVRFGQDSSSPVRFGQDSSSPVRFGQASSSPVRFGRMDMTLREDQGDKPKGSSSSSGASSSPAVYTTEGDFLAERGSPLPYSKISNVIGTLNEHLQKLGERPADIIVTPHSQTSFSAKVFFTLRGEKRECDSDTRFRNKKDARQNAAYVALVALNLITPPGEQTASPSTETRDSSPGPSHTSSSQRTPNKNYKNLLQEYCQKNSHPVPLYKANDVGDQHSHAFEATVTVKLNDGRLINETSDRLDTKKAATFQAAERAYNSIRGGQRLGGGTSDSSPQQPTTPVKDGVTTTINWKNKLQELFQKSGLPPPKYRQVPGLDGFKSTVYLELDKDGSKNRRFTSELRKNVKSADMHAAELAYRAIAENTSEIGQIGRTGDFRNWHNSRYYPLPDYDTRVVKRHPKMSFISTVRFNSGRNAVEGEEQSSKKTAENSATQRAIQILKEKGLWDVADL